MQIIIFLLTISSLSYAQEYPQLSCTIEIVTPENEVFSKTMVVSTEEDSLEQTHDLRLREIIMQVTFAQNNRNLFNVFFGHEENKLELGSGMFDLRDTSNEGKIASFISHVKNHRYSLACVTLLAESIEQYPVDDFENDIVSNVGTVSAQQFALIRQVLMGRIEYLEKHFIPSLETALVYHKRVNRKKLMPYLTLSLASVFTDIIVHETTGMPLDDNSFIRVATTILFGSGLVGAGINLAKNQWQNREDKKLIKHLRNRRQSVLSGMESEALQDDLENFISDLATIKNEHNISNVQMMELVRIFNERIGRHLRTSFNPMKREITSLGNAKTEAFLLQIMPNIEEDERKTNKLIEGILFINPIAEKSGGKTAQSKQGTDYIGFFKEANQTKIHSSSME